MLKPSEIIRMAMNHPSYLNGWVNDYLCHVIKYSLDLSDDEKKAASLCIYDSMKTEHQACKALDGYLFLTGKISNTCIHGTEEYKQAAFEHWNKLIEKLEKEGN